LKDLVDVESAVWVPCGVGFALNLRLGSVSALGFGTCEVGSLGIWWSLAILLFEGQSMYPIDWVFDQKWVTDRSFGSAVASFLDCFLGAPFVVV